MKKKLMAFLLTAAMVTGLCACGNKAPAPTSDTGETTQETGSTESTEATPSSGEEIVLKYTGWGSPSEKKTTQNVIKNFEATHPGVKVEYVHIPTDYNTKLTTMIAAGQGPDVALLNGDTALQWASQGKLKDIMELSAGDTEWSIDDILPQTVYWYEEGKACGVNGALEVFALVYNNDVFKEAGISVPTTEAEAWTWEEFVEVCQKLTIDQKGRNALDPEFDAKNIKQFGIFIPSGGNMLSYAMAYCGEDFLTEDGTKVNITNPKVLESIQKFADLINLYHVAPNQAQAKNLPGGSTALASKKVAMVWDGQWALMEMVTNKVNFGVGIPPKMYDKPMTIALGEPVVVFETTKYPKEAWELQKAFMDAENTMELIAGGLWMPVTKNYYEDETLINSWAANNPAHPEGYIDAVLNNGFTNGVPSLSYSIQNFPKIMDVLNPALDKVWLGEQTAEEAIKAVEDKMNAEVKGKYVRPE